MSSLDERTKFNYSIQCSPCDFYRLLGIHNSVEVRSLAQPYRGPPILFHLQSSTSVVQLCIWGSFCLRIIFPNSMRPCVLVARSTFVVPRWHGCSLIDIVAKAVDCCVVMRDHHCMRLRLNQNMYYC